MRVLDGIELKVAQSEQLHVKAEEATMNAAMASCGLSRCIALGTMRSRANGLPPMGNCHAEDTVAAGR